MTITPESKASVLGAAVENVQFQPSVSVVPRKIGIIATYDPTFLDVIDNVPVRVFSASEAGSKFGFGFMADRLAEQAFIGSRGNVGIWIIPQPETGGNQSAGSIDFAGSTGVKGGVLPFYVASRPAFADLIDGETPQNIALKIIDAVNADKKLPLTAALNLTDTIVDFTSKSEGTWGDDITLSFALRPGETVDSGVTAAITGMTGGSGIPDVQDALDGMGVGDNQNESFFTDLICGYGKDTATLDKISVYNGVGNLKIGNYKEETSRPFRSLIGDTVEGTAGLSALIAFADLRRELDRTNGIIGVPGCFHHPMELAAVTMGVMADTNSLRAEENYVNKIMPGIIAGPSTDRWTDNYQNGRDLAVRSGVGTSQFKNNTVTIQDIITFYRPEAVDAKSNGYRSMRNTSITQNKLANLRAIFQVEDWQNISIMENKLEATDLISQEKVKDSGDVEDALLILNELFTGKAWNFNKAFFIEKLKAGGLVNLREDGRGWNIKFPTIYSGEGGIFNSTIQFDVSLAVFIN